MIEKVEPVKRNSITEIPKINPLSNITSNPSSNRIDELSGEDEDEIKSSKVATVRDGEQKEFTSPIISVEPMENKEKPDDNFFNQNPSEE